MKQIIYSTLIEDNFKNEEDMISFYKEELEINNIEIPEDINMNDVYESIYDYINTEYECFSEVINCFDKRNHNSILVAANIGRWNGRFESGKIVTTLDKAINTIISNEDDFVVYIENNVLKITTHNHDASSYFDLYELTNKGQEYYERNEKWYDDIDMYKHLLSVKSYNKNIKLWRN